MNVLRLTLTPAALLAWILPLAACGGGSLNWTEDVVLPDGRTVTLTQHQEFKGPHELGQPPTTSAYWFEFDDPSTGERVRWENDRTLSTISLSVNENVPELLTTTNYDGIFRYKCPDPPYLAFQFVNKAWVQIPLTRLVRKVLPVNMTSPGSDLREGLTSDSYLSAAEVQRVLPYQRRGKVVDLSTVTAQTFGVRCRPPFNYMMRDSGSAKYPPYPETWDWLPTVPPPEGATPSLRRMPDGDVLISLLGTNDEVMSFFGRARFESTQAGLGGGRVWIGEPHSLKRRDGRWLLAIPQGECTRGLGSGLYLNEAQGERIRATAFVWVGKDAKTLPTTVCEEQERSGFDSRAFILEPTGLAELRDGSILMAERGAGLVLRVRVAPDGTVCTRSALLGDSLFLVDDAWLQQRFRQQERRDGVDWPAFFDSVARELRARPTEGRC